MLQDDDSGDDIFRIDEPERPSWFAAGDAWSWLFPVLGLALFEIFAHPAVAAAVACLKFGYADFRTALWLRGDPIPLRGGALGACYLTRGLFVSAGWGLLFAFVLPVLASLFQNKNNDPLAALQSALFGAAIVMCGSTLLGFVVAPIALARVVNSRLRVWMDPTIHVARRERRWTSVCRGRRNGFPRLCLGLLIPCLFWLVGMIAGAISVFFTPKFANDPWLAKYGSVVIFLFMSGPGLIGILALLKARRHAAHSPVECWGAM